MAINGWLIPKPI